jgi:hypothetical protein
LCNKTYASDNGTEFTGRAILKWASDNDVDWHYIDPGKPPQLVESWPFGDTITITSDHTHRWEIKRPLKRGVRLDNLRVPRTMRLPKLTMKNMKFKHQVQRLI